MTKKVERTITIAAPLERVWKAWVEEMNAWWTMPYYNDHDRATGLYLEPKLGGHYIEQWGEGGAGFLIGQVTVWNPAHCLAYTWTQMDWGGVNTHVRIDFQPDGNDGTRLIYVQEGFERLPDGDGMREGYDHGNAELLGRLRAYIETGKPS